VQAHGVAHDVRDDAILHDVQRVVAAKV